MPRNTPRLRNQNRALPRTIGHAKGLLGEKADETQSRLLQQPDCFVWLQRGVVVFMSEALNELLEEYQRLNPEDFDA